MRTAPITLPGWACRGDGKDLIRRFMTGHYTRIGEGGYAEMEAMIRRLVGE